MKIARNGASQGERHVTELWEGPKRQHQRIALEVEVLIVRNGAILPGRTLNISESGVAVILPVELHEG